MKVKKKIYKKQQKIILNDGSIIYIKTVNLKKIVKL